MKQIIKKPVVSEKSFAASGKDKFTFLTSPDADKDTIKAVVEDLYGVTVLSVNTQKIAGKVKRSRGKIGVRNNYKKAIVTLKAGQKIALFEVETEESKADKKADITSKKADKKAENAENKDVTTTIKTPKDKKEKK